MALEGAVQLLNQICEDRTIPKNIRKQCESAEKLLKNNEKELRIKIDAVLEVMDNISEPSKPPAEHDRRKLVPWTCSICHLVILAHDGKKPKFFTQVPYVHHCAFRERLDH